MIRNVFAFYGADHKAGCTMVSQCVAEKIAADLPDSEVLFLRCSQNSGADYYPKAMCSMDSIRPYLDEDLINIDNIRFDSRYKNNLSVIGGNRSSVISGDIHPDKAVFLIRSLANSFDVVICDCGAQINDGLALGAMISCNAAYIVLTRSEASFKRYEWQRELLDKLSVPVNCHILNRFTRKSHITKAYACERLGIGPESLFAVRDSGFGELCESEERSILSYKEIGFTRDIAVICENIKGYLNNGQ